MNRINAFTRFSFLITIKAAAPAANTAAPAAAAITVFCRSRLFLCCRSFGAFNLINGENMLSAVKGRYRIGAVGVAGGFISGFGIRHIIRAVPYYAVFINLDFAEFGRAVFKRSAVYRGKAVLILRYALAVYRAVGVPCKKYNFGVIL